MIRVCCSMLWPEEFTTQYFRTRNRQNRGDGWFFFFQAEDGIRDLTVTGVQTCALPISAVDLQSTTVLGLRWQKLLGVVWHWWLDVPEHPATDSERSPMPLSCAWPDPWRRADRKSVV